MNCDQCGLDGPDCQCWLSELSTQVKVLSTQVQFLAEELDKLTDVVKAISDAVKAMKPGKSSFFDYLEKK